VTSALILQLQLNDVEQLLLDEARRCRGANAGDASEWEQALLHHKDEIQRGLVAINDRQISNKLALAIAKITMP
jgi:hypothetical protein